jgi:ribosomal protein S18 acetylase RimI-like enzyme
VSAAMSQSPLQVMRLTAPHQRAVEVLFARVAADVTGARFHPHPFTTEEAARICRHAGKDLYFGMLRDGAFVGYGMLRGWNEGFRVPSLGIYIAPEMRGTGAARILMQHLHESAKLAGATRIRLQVHADNLAARQLYLSLGYRFDDAPQADGQLLGFFDIPSS